MPDLLLDTHVVLWLVAAPERLGQGCREAIGEAATVHVSAVTHAELQIKAALGKLSLPAELPRRLSEQGLRPLAFTESHALAFAAFAELARRDPFDRMLLAQARTERLDLWTADRRLLGLDLDWVQDARV